MDIFMRIHPLPATRSYYDIASSNVINANDDDFLNYRDEIIKREIYLFFLSFFFF